MFTLNLSEINKERKIKNAIREWLNSSSQDYQSLSLIGKNRLLRGKVNEYFTEVIQYVGFGKEVTFLNTVLCYLLNDQYLILGRQGDQVYGIIFEICEYYHFGRINGRNLTLDTREEGDIRRTLNLIVAHEFQSQISSIVLPLIVRAMISEHFPKRAKADLIKVILKNPLVSYKNAREGFDLIHRNRDSETFGFFNERSGVQRFFKVEKNGFYSDLMQKTRYTALKKLFFYVRVGLKRSRDLQWYRLDREQQKPLFTESRSSFWFTGKYKTTNAVKQIENLKEEILFARR